MGARDARGRRAAWPPRSLTRRAISVQFLAGNSGIQDCMPKTVTVCHIDDIPPGERKLVEADGIEIGVFNCGGTFHAIEDRCSHDDGPLAEGEFDADACTVECPRHGSLFDLSTGAPKTLPAYVPVETFPVVVEDGLVKLEV
jgi:3-phenylpropionate/trans-cinnamate dioxygenase ferredoxin subunit